MLFDAYLYHRENIMSALTKLLRRLALLAGLSLAAQANATLIYNDWTGESATTGNYILTINHVGNQFSYNLTVNPWNAEALGLFIDLGSITIGSVNLGGTTPSAPVSLYATDTSSSSCGTGCNLNGLSLPALAGGDWELVFRLGGTGFDGIQTFNWTTSDFGLGESAFGLVGIRAQQLCTGSSVLPDGSCTGSDKAYAYASNSVPEPSALMLSALALLALGMVRRRA